MKQYKMTVDEFFNLGYKFIDGDSYADFISTMIVGEDILVEDANIREDGDKHRYVVSAKALEDSVNTSSLQEEQTIVQNIPKIIQIMPIPDDNYSIYGLGDDGVVYKSSIEYNNEGWKVAIDNKFI